MKILIETKSYGMKEILFDDVDEYKINKYTWHIVKEGNGLFYARAFEKIDGKYKTIRMHRFIMGVHNSDKPHIDHKNHNTLDNRRDNLRRASMSENVRNRKINSTNKTGYKGVNRTKTGRWVASIKAGGRHFGGKYFDSPKEAAQEYNKLAVKHHGEFAYLNKI